MVAAGCTAGSVPARVPLRDWRAAVGPTGARLLLAEAKQVRREARGQFRLLRQLIAAGDEDDAFSTSSARCEARCGGLGDLYLRMLWETAEVDPGFGLPRIRCG